MIWTLWKPLRLSNPPATQARKRFADEHPIRAHRILVLGSSLALAASLVLSGTATAYSLSQLPGLRKTPAALLIETAAATEAAQETPGYGVSGYFTLGSEGGSAIRAVPRVPLASPALNIQLQGGRLQVTSPRAEGGMLALRIIDARGRVVRTWNETLLSGGSVVLALDGKMRGLLILQVDGRELGRAVMIVPPLRDGAW
jgi:hypothetical protein